MTDRFDASQRDFTTWADFFYKYGFIVLDNALSMDVLESIKADLDSANESAGGGKQKKRYKTNHIMHKRFFEQSPTTARLVESSVLFDFAQHVIGDVPGRRGNGLNAHIIHNNAFSVKSGGRGQAPVMHIDDCLQQIIVPDGVELPESIRLPVLAVTWMVWLSDCTSPENGPTYVVPGSHRWGKVPDAEIASAIEVPTCGPAGTAVLVNCQTWHRGCENKSDVSRDTLQMTFARRMIGHKFGSIMNYVLPPHITDGKSDEILDRWGFQEGGAYS